MVEQVTGVEGSSPRVPAVHNCVAILRLLAESPLPVPGGAIARRLRLPRSSTYQILQTLVEEGLVVALPERHGFALGMGAFELGSAYLQHRPLENIARPILRRLVKRVGATAHLGILYGHETLYLLKEQPPRPSPLVTAVGVRLPAHLTATGRAMLAYLSGPQVSAIFAGANGLVSRTGQGPRTLRELRTVLRRERGQGWTMEAGEITDGVTSVSSPVFAHGGFPVASVSVSVDDMRFGVHRQALLVQEVCRAADEVTNFLGGQTPVRSAASDFDNTGVASA